VIRFNNKNKMSTISDPNGSIPDMGEDVSRGSSVSTNFVNEYEEILKYAIVAPKVQVQEDAYNVKELNLDIQQTESSESDLSHLSSVHSNSKVTENVLLKMNRQTSNMNIETKQLHFDAQRNNAMDTLLDFTGVTPSRGDHQPAHVTDSNKSTPESIHGSPSAVDKDLIRMDGLMDDWLLQVKRNVLSEMADMKMRHFQNEENSIRDLKAKHNSEMLRLNHDIESLKELLYSFEQSVKQKDEVITNLTQVLNKQKEKSDKIRLFSMWRLKHNDEQRQGFATKMAEKYYNKTLCAKVWVGWRSVVENKWKQRVEKACQIKSQEICLQLTQDYEERIQALQRELNTTRGEVAHMHTERDHYEENMKKAFMRGVCALNMEAMSMFKEGKPNEGSCGTERVHPSCIPPNEYHSQNTLNADALNTFPNGNEQNKMGANKHVTFSSTNNISNRPPSSNSNNRLPNNRKNVNVKMTGKRELSRKEQHSGTAGKQSTISSIKVERHLPIDKLASKPSTLKQKNEINKLSYQNKVKIVD